MTRREGQVSASKRRLPSMSPGADHGQSQKIWHATSKVPYHHQMDLDGHVLFSVTSASALARSEYSDGFQRTMDREILDEGSHVTSVLLYSGLAPMTPRKAFPRFSLVPSPSNTLAELHRRMGPLLCNSSRTSCHLLQPGVLTSGQDCGVRRAGNVS